MLIYVETLFNFVLLKNSESGLSHISNISLMLRKSVIIAAFMVSSLHHFSQEKEILIYHPIQTDNSGKIIPWFDENPGRSYDHVINLVWNFWDHMRQDMNGLPYYMNHQVWNVNFNDPRGIGGDPFANDKWKPLSGDGLLIVRRENGKKSFC
jgi:hypothetical protein